jgi:peptidoglycan/xylan/chitin deacetylase (PgdA/CDA1 family)
LVLAKPANGLIVCLHDGRGLAEKANIANTLEAVRRLIPQLLERGCQFETVSEIVRPQAPPR